MAASSNRSFFDEKFTPWRRNNHFRCHSEKIIIPANLHQWASLNPGAIRKVGKIYEGCFAQCAIDGADSGSPELKQTQLGESANA
ncbi:hypothetical protein CEXT_31011 [Caerostris extrusa]|uniref:Uncharacterized protein n=1 Tax=Caerostris extrusa TaxID=172846 RepID=A0AAV4SAR7_CAEEX|nr:hypothetical protein CEXT_31011 [Caerostris extrusa]